MAADREPGATDTERALWTIAGMAWVAFAVLALAVGAAEQLGLDQWFRDAVHHRPITHGSISFVLAHLGSGMVLWPVAIVTAGVWAGWSRRLLPLAIVLGSYGIVSAVVGPVKVALHRAEPGDAIGELGRSFPSGHAASAVAVWGGLAMCWFLTSDAGPVVRRRVLVLAGALIGLVCIVMLWRAAHWLTDVIGGLAVGMAALASTSALALRVGLAGPRPTPRMLDVSRWGRQPA